MDKKSDFVSEIKSAYRDLSKQQKWLYFLYAILLFSYFLPFFRAVENRIGLSAFTEVSDYFFIAIAVLGCIKIFIGKLRSWDYIIVICLGIYYKFNLAAHPEFMQYVSQEGPDVFLWSCLPLYLVGRTIDEDSSPRMFVAIGYIAILVQILFLYFLGVEEDENGNIELMGEAYAILPFVLFMVWDAFERRTLFRTVIAIVSVFFLLSLGTRGPIVCLAVFIAAYFILFKDLKKVYKILFAVLAGIVFYFSSMIAIGLSLISSSIGMSTRVFDSIQQNRMFNLQESNGRDDIWNNAWNYLLSHDKLWGGGLFADRIANNGEHYAHNFEIELLCDFGFIGGSFIFCLLLWLMYKAWKNNNGTNGLIFFLVFFCASFMQLQFTGSFLQAPVFWFFLGLCMTFAFKNSKNYV